MGTNILKIIILVIVACTSLEVASTQINDLVKSVEAREETITDVIIKKQVAETFKEVEKQIETVTQEEKIVIETEKVEMKPPVEEKKIEKVENNGPKEELQEVAEVAPEVAEADSDQVEILTVEDMNYVGQYLVEHYFLDGYTYYQKEEDAILKERKKLAHEMEVYTVESLQSVLEVLLGGKKLNEEGIHTILQDAYMLQTSFKEEFQEKINALEDTEKGLPRIYTEVESYFDQYIQTLEQMKSSLLAIKTAVNPSLAVGIVLKDMSEVIIPGIKQVIGSGFALKEATNPIYLEGIPEEDYKLLTPEAVIEIIKDPNLVLDKG